MANPYFIKILLPDEEGEKSAVAGSTNSNANSASPDPTFNRVMNASKKLISFSAAASTADKLISYRISTVNLRTGAAEYEQRLETIHSIGKDIVGAGAALVTGAKLGGRAGFAVALIGVAASGINKLINLAQKEQTLMIEQSLENVTQGMMNIRAGAGARRGAEQ